MIELRCQHCNHTYFAARRSSVYCSTKCRVAANRRRAAQAKKDRTELADYGKAACHAIASISGIGQLPSEVLRARGTLKHVWIVASETMLELGVTREQLRELLIK